MNCCVCLSHKGKESVYIWIWYCICDEFEQFQMSEPWNKLDKTLFYEKFYSAIKIVSSRLRLQVIPAIPTREWGRDILMCIEKKYLIVYLD